MQLIEGNEDLDAEASGKTQETWTCMDVTVRSFIMMYFAMSWTNLPWGTREGVAGIVV
jgi:hypothetical protein